MISIIVPVYNSEKTLHKCVDSLLAQTYSDIEILLIIDGPTDSSVEIGRAYEVKDSRVRVIQKENEGVSKARNTGLFHAKGEYIQFVDSDDYIAENMCECLLRNVEKSGAQMAICGYHHLFLERDIIKVPEQSVLVLKDRPDEFLRLYECGYLNMPWNKLFKKEVVENVFEENLSLGEDLLFNLDYMKRIDKIVLLSEPLYFYIQKNGQDNLSTKKRKDKYEIAVKLCEAVKENYEKLLLQAGQSGDKEKIKAGNAVIHKRLILEFLDEIEGMAYDKTLTKQEKLDTIEKYMQDAYIQAANQGIGKLQIDYAIINYFFLRKKKNAVYILIYVRKWCLALLRGRA
ncbi:glycosyltransferase family 2 protein [Konateibacter massiliensis]|uniref:glycosyltransferase family 2 protein n=1 Tax=Konateibacter massiliensis TaxID=2002841 RepID=UPI000C144A87|nr:glycosyltransferase family 2 protein [Konateibacter massiliensis]